ncbi:hypothetical protein NE237_015549 [Protea cynaroides]|uniref:Uncharacterized protein n=1 Tax=Protea cynaroides TaxID=273540 RepID=A0A9Q0QR64_9MAGN|nr:hypothetical protein NE237_015549 [Protea cynaroides]
MAMASTPNTFHSTPDPSSTESYFLLASSIAAALVASRCLVLTAIASSNTTTSLVSDLSIVKVSMSSARSRKPSPEMKATSVEMAIVFLVILHNWGKNCNKNFRLLENFGGVMVTNMS